MMVDMRVWMQSDVGTNSGQVLYTRRAYDLAHRQSEAAGPSPSCTAPRGLEAGRGGREGRIRVRANGCPRRGSFQSV